MNRKQDINGIIRNFFEHRYSQATRHKFGWWLLHHDDKEASERVMQQLWNESKAATAGIPDEDMMRLRQAIGRDRRKEFVARYGAWLAAAACLGAVFLSSYITCNIAKNKSGTQTRAQEFVRITVPDKEIRCIYLSDSTSVVLNSGSTLIYPKQFTAGARTVFLLGEAGFDVRKDAGRPFVVETECLSVTALGTRFSVTSYAALSFAGATLASGRIRVDIADARSDRRSGTFVLAPDQGLSYDKQSGKTSIYPTNADRALSWKEGKLIFDGVKFEDAMNGIERKYGVTVVCRDATKMKGLYHAKFEATESVRQVLDLLSRLGRPFRYRMYGDTVQVMPR